MANGAPLKRPYVLINMAITADGKIAAPESQFSRFGSAHDTKLLYTLRATVDAILCGVTTVHKEKAVLDVPPAYLRRKGNAAKHPWRIVVTGRGRLDQTAPLLQDLHAPTMVITSQRARFTFVKRCRQNGITVLQSPEKDIRWERVLHELKTRWKIKRLLCEGGGELNQSLLRQDLVDEVRLTVCPIIVGGRSAPTMAGEQAFSSLTACPEWQFTQTRKRGKEMFLTLKRKR